MAYYNIEKVVKHNNNEKKSKYKALVRHKQHGKIIFKKQRTFQYKDAATKWAKKMVYDIEHNQQFEQTSLTLVTVGKLITQYIDSLNKGNRPLGRTAQYSLKQTLRYPIAKTSLRAFCEHDIIVFAQHRKEALTKPKPQTIDTDICILRGVFRHAYSLFKYDVDETPFRRAYPTLRRLQLVSKSQNRDRRLEDGEYDLFANALSEYQCSAKSNIPLYDIFQLSLLTCLRVSELCNLRWVDLNKSNKTIVVRGRKDPQGRQPDSRIPLLSNSFEILTSQPELDERILPVNPRSVTAGFRRVRKGLGIKDLRYHDLRREAASRLIEQGYSLNQVAILTGHKDLKVLHNIYINLRPESLF